MLLLLDVKCLVLLIQLNQNQVQSVVITPLLQDGKKEIFIQRKKKLISFPKFSVILFMVRIQKKRLNVKLIYGFDPMKLPIGHIQPKDGSMNEYIDLQVEQTTI
jgi:hypothetical protein